MPEDTLPQNSLTDRDTVWVVDSGQLKEACYEGHIDATWWIWLNRVQRRCGLMSNYFDHLLLLWFYYYCDCSQPNYEWLLLQVVWHSMQDEFIKQIKYFESMISKCYPDSGITFEFTIDNLLGYFSDIAQLHWPWRSVHLYTLFSLLLLAFSALMPCPCSPMVKPLGCHVQ